MQDFRELHVWQKAHNLVLGVYRSTKDFPLDERYGLTSQLRRGAASIPANIAEGCGRRGGRELRRFLDIASGSASELEYHLLLARDLEYLPADQYVTLNNATCEIKRMLSGFVKRLTSGDE